MNNAFFQDHFQGAVEKHFAARGFEQVRSGEASDLLVHYHAHVATRISPNNGDPASGACYDENCTVRVIENDLGTMMIDIVDGRTNRLIWRGWAQTNIDGVIDHPDRFASRIDQAVTRMFARFPRPS